MIGRLAAEPCHVYGLARMQAANVYARRSVDKNINWPGPVIYNYDESEGQVIEYWLSDYCAHLDQFAFG